ncbi:MAG TPA: DinB family protein [Gemmatimonadaceae bacterium]
MLDLNTSLAGTRAAVSDLLAAADGAAASWTAPRAPGKWSPSQVVEHVARLMDESTKVVTGAPSEFPKIPIFFRPILRLLVFRRTLRRHAFPNMKAIPAFDPASGSATPAKARVRLEGVLRRFDQACRARAASGQDVKSTIFGPVSVAEFVKFQELHVRHHRLQMPGVAYRPSHPRNQRRVSSVRDYHDHGRNHRG